MSGRAYGIPGALAPRPPSPPTAPPTPLPAPPARAGRPRRGRALWSSLPGFYRFFIFLLQSAPGPLQSSRSSGPRPEPAPDSCPSAAAPSSGANRSHRPEGAAVFDVPQSPVSTLAGLSEPCRLADGRQRYRLRRRRAMHERRSRLAKLLAQYGSEPGAVARAAENLASRSRPSMRTPVRSGRPSRARFGPAGASDPAT